MPKGMCLRGDAVVVGWTYADTQLSGDDDYFSSDLSDEVKASIWGRFDKPVLVLNSENDEYVPKYVDQAALNQKYRDLNPMVSQLSGIIPDTGHQVFEEAAREWLGNKVAEFLRTL